MLTAEQHAKRDGKIGASFIPMLMAAKPEEILNEWRRLVGDPDYVEPDFSDNWPVQFGSYVEPFALNWVEKKTGMPLTMRGVWCPHPELDYLGATLDAYRAAEKRVLDCKTCHAFRVLEDVQAYYTAQLVVQKSAVNAHNTSLLVVHGGLEAKELDVTWDADYERQVWERIKWFWGRVETLQPPCEIPPVKGAAAAVRIVDMTRNNKWANEAGIYLANKPAAKLFTAAEKAIKELIGADVAKAHGHGIIASRNKAGAISIKEGRFNG